MVGPDHDRDAARGQHFVERVGDLRRQLLYFLTQLARRFFGQPQRLLCLVPHGEALRSGRDCRATLGVCLRECPLDVTGDLVGAFAPFSLDANVGPRPDKADDGDDDGDISGMVGGTPGGVVGGVPGGLVGGVIGGTGTELSKFPTPDVGARPLRMPLPSYTEEAIRQNVQGSIKLRVVIDEQGKVHVLEILRSIPELDDEAIRTVESSWRFEPAMKNGRPIPCLSDLIVRFNLY